MVLTLLGCAAPSPRVDPLGHEYVEPIDILGADGLVRARGWAREPLFGFDRAMVLESRRDRIREWDFYAVHTDDFAVNATVAEVVVGGNHLVLASVVVQDFLAGTAAGPNWFTLDDADRLDFSPDPGGTYALSFGEGTLEYAMEGDERVVRFADGDDHGELRIGASTGESIAVVTPFPDAGHFFYENKVLGLPAAGEVVVGGRRYPVPTGSLATLDFARSVMPAEVRWTWGTAAGEVDGRLVTVNLGSVFGDESRGTPAAVTVDGKLHKLGVVDWTFDLDDVLAPWSFRSDDGRVDLALVSDHDIVEITDVDLGFYEARLHKLYGRWSGTVVLDDGETLTLDGLLGAAEYLETSW